MNSTETLWQSQLEDWVKDNRKYTAEGKCASYIPALQHVDPSALGICMIAQDGTKARIGDWDTSFTMQSVSKIINFLAAYEARGLDKMLERVDVEPTGDAFDSIIRLEAHKPGKPFNPMINAGAITVASMLPGNTSEDKMHAFTTLMEKMIGRHPTINQKVYESERSTAHRNRALAHYLKGLGYLDSEVEEALDVYFHECSMEVTSEDLAQIGLILACNGFHPFLQEQIVSEEATRIIKSLMVTCGMYNESGKFAAFVGIPAKSGVSGAILAAVPKRNMDSDIPFTKGCGIGVYSPAIDEFGNSVAGVRLLKQIAKSWNLQIF